MAAIGWADESSEREGRERQRTGTTIELAECEAMRRLSQPEHSPFESPYLGLNMGICLFRYNSETCSKYEYVDRRIMRGESSRFIDNRCFAGD